MLSAERSQLIVTTHSPFFVDPLRAEDVRVIYRGTDGYSQAKRVADMRGIPEMLEEGGSLGDLGMEGHFDVGDPLAEEDEQ
jgi:predicted ATPase